MEPGIPVWSIKPNWAGGVLERLEWLTDVIPAKSSGAEQRRALRPSPRRYIEITVHPTRQERSYLDLLLHRLGHETWLFPLWFDLGKLSAPAAATDVRVAFDNTYREHGQGEYALLFKDAFTWEVISVAASDDTGLDLADPLEGDWPAGTTLLPLRLATLPAGTSLAAITGRVGESVLMFQLAQANDFAEVEPDTATFEGAPVLTSKPNRSQEITLDHVRLTAERDNSVGIPFRSDPVDRAFQVQSHSWMVNGRQAHTAMRSLLYWLRGRQRALWVPSFNDDVIVTTAAAATTLNLDIENIGMGYVGGGEIVEGRDVLWIEGAGARVTEIGAPPSAGRERLRIGAGMPVDVPAGASGSFMGMARLNQDAVELLHHTDTDGTMEVSVTFQTFADVRDPSGPIYFPIPDAAMSDTPCGAPEPGLFSLDWDFKNGVYYTGGVLVTGDDVDAVCGEPVMSLNTPDVGLDAIPDISGGFAGGSISVLFNYEVPVPEDLYFMVEFRMQDLDGITVGGDGIGFHLQHFMDDYDSLDYRGRGMRSFVGDYAPASAFVSWSWDTGSDSGYERQDATVISTDYSVLQRHAALSKSARIASSANGSAVAGIDGDLDLTGAQPRRLLFEWSGSNNTMTPNNHRITIERVVITSVLPDESELPGLSVP